MVRIVSADDFLAKSDREPFAMVPAWLICKVPPATLEFYVGLARMVDTGGARRRGDFFCWCSHETWCERYRPIAWATFKGHVDRLEDVGAVLVCTTRRRKMGPDDKLGGKQGANVFYLSPLNVAMVGPVELEMPTRLDFQFSMVTPRRLDVTLIRRSDGRRRTGADQPARKSQTATQRDLNGDTDRDTARNLHRPRHSAEQNETPQESPVVNENPAEICPSCLGDPNAYGSGLCPSCRSMVIVAPATGRITEEARTA